MNPYRDLDDAYQRLARRPARRTILTRLGAGLDAIVATIRYDTPDSDTSDQTLRALIAAGRTDSDALTVALYTLAPELRARLSRTATGEYHADALRDLALVILDSDLDGPGLAHRLVNPAHNRVWRSARRVHTRGVLNVMTTVPCPPDRLARLHDQRPGRVAARRAARRLAPYIDTYLGLHAA